MMTPFIRGAEFSIIDSASVTLSVSPSEVAEDGGAQEVTVTAEWGDAADSVLQIDTTVALTWGGTGDYSRSGGDSVTIPAGSRSGTTKVTITPADDNLFAGDSQTIRISGSAPGRVVSPADLTITEDETAPAVTLAVDVNSLQEDDGADTVVTVSATLSTDVAVANEDTNVTLELAGTATLGTDYTAGWSPSSRVITIPPGTRAGSNTLILTLTPTNDSAEEGDETILVQGTAVTDTSNSKLEVQEATITLEDDDAQLTLTVDADNNTPNVQSSLAENGGAKTVKVTATLGGSTQFDVDKTLTLIVGGDGDSATEGTDYTDVADITLTIPAGDQDVEHTFTLTPTDDAFYEANETISLEGTLAGVTVSGDTITLTSEDAAPAITLTVDADKDTDNVQTSLAEDGGVKTVRVTATLDGTTRLEAAADLALAVGKNSDSAVEGTDYTTVADRTITIGAGVASVTDDFTLTPTNDVLHEGAETISLDGTLSGVAVTDTSLTLTDDDTQPSFAVADASAAEGDATTFTVTRSGAMDNVVSVKWNTKAATGAGAAATTDYTAMTTATKLDFAKGVGSQTFTVATTEDTLHEGDETFLVELTEPVGAIISDAEATGTITDDDAAPTGITLIVDTNGAEDGTPSTVAEDAGATVVTVTATVNGTTRYVDAKTVAVSVDDDTAASPADYAAVSGFNITIAAGAASHTGSFTVTPVDDDLDESNETIDVTGTLSGVTVAAATVTLTDTDAPVSFSIADAEATEGGKVTFTVSRGGAEDNVASVKVATTADSGDDVNAAGTDDYTAISPAQTLNFAKGVASQTVEVQTTQDDLFEPDETFKAVLSAPALAEDDPGTGVSIETGKGTAIGTIKNDDTQPSFAVADASASEGDAITFTVTRSGAMDNAVSVKWNTKADSGDGANAASATDYTPVTTATTLTFAKGVGRQTFAVATTEDTLHEGDETFLVELSEPVGGIISDAEATGTITDDDAAPTGLTLSVDADTGTMGTQTSLAEDGGAKTVRVTATLGGSSTFAEAKMVTVEVGPDADGATEGTDYTEVTSKSITIDAGALSGYVDFTLTPTDDDIDEPNEGISIEGTLTGVTVTGTAITLTDDEDVPTVTLVLTPSTINESGNGNASTVTAMLSGKSSAAVTVTVSVPNDAPVTLSTNATLSIAAGATTSTGTVTITAVDNDVDAANASVLVSGVAAGGSVVNPADQTLTITDDEGTPTVTLVLTPSTINESGNGNASTVTATLSGESSAAVTVEVSVPNDAPVTLSGNTTLTIAAGSKASTGTVTITAVDNDIDAPNKTVTVSATASGGGVGNPTDQTLTITDDDAAPSGITLSVSPATLGEGDGLTRITVTATVNGSTRYVDAKTVTVSVGSGTAISGTDFDAVSNFDITIAAAGASQTGMFDLTPTDDALHEEDETIEVTGTSGALTIAPATVTITDNDAAGPVGTVSLSASRYEVLEGDSLSVTVSLSESPAADTMIELEATSPGGYSATPGADYDGGVQTVTIRAGTTSGKARIWTTRDNQNDPNETFKLAIRASDLPGTVTLGEPDTAVVTIRERVSGITPPATATVVYAGRNSRISMPVPVGLKGHGIDVAFYFDIGPGTARGGGDCREDGTDLVDWGHFPAFPPGTVRSGPVVRVIEDINTDTIELRVELCEGSVGKTFTASWDTIQYLGNPDRGFPGVKSNPFNAAAAHCTSTALCYTKVTIIGDTPDPDPEVTIAAGGDITEGGDAIFTVQASPAPASDLEIALAIADDVVSDFLADGEEGSKTVTIAAGSDTATYTLATTDDDLEEADGGVSATLEAGTGYQVGSPSTATVAVADNDNDDDARATVVRISGGADITEGGVARFTLTGAPSPSQDLTVNLRVTQGGAFAGNGELGARTVTLGTDGTVTVDIPTVDDSTLEDDGSLTIAVEPGTGYTPHATDASATVAVADDEVPSLPTIHIDDVEAAEGDDLHFTFTLSHAVDHEVDVWWETRFGPNPDDDENGHGPSYGEAIPHADFRYADSRVTVYPGGTRGEFWVETFDDSHDEGRETLTVVLTDVTGAIIADELAIGTIVNLDPMPAAWLGRFGRAVAEQAIEGISERIESAGWPGRDAEPGFWGTIAGITLGGQRGADEDSGSGESDGPGAEAPAVERPDGASGAFGFGAGAMPSQPGAFGHPTLGPQPAGSILGTGAPAAPGGGPGGFGEGPVQRGAYGYGAEQQLAQMLLGSHFTYTGKADEAGGVLGYWGRGAQTRFDGAEGNLNLDGEVTTAMLGVDYARSNWLVGMALTQSLGSGGYRGSGTPVQGSAGINAAAAAASGASLMDGAIETTLTAAIPYASWRASERIEGLAATESAVSRLRLGVEASREFALPSGGSLAPKLEVGARHDSGKAEVGFGVEAGGGIAWTDPRLGIELDLLGRTLIAHEDDAMGDKGFSASLAFDPRSDSEQGLAMTLRQDIGATASGGLEALFSNDPLARRTQGSDSSRLTAELGYGWPLFGDRFIGVPHLGYSLTQNGREIGIGWRLAPDKELGAADITLKVLATRAASLQGESVDHRVGIQIQARW